MKRWGWLLLVAAVAAAGLVSWPGSSRPERGENGPVVASFASPWPVPEFDMVASSGRPARLSDWRGKMLLIFFGYTHCPDVCPLTLAQLAALYELLEAPAQVQVLMITVDPERDTPERLAAYLRPFHPSFIGLTASPAVIHQAMDRFHALAQRADPLVLHTDAVALVAADGGLLALYGQSAVAEGGRFDEATLAELERTLRQALRGVGTSPLPAGGA